MSYAACLKEGSGGGARQVGILRWSAILVISFESCRKASCTTQIRFFLIYLSIIKDEIESVKRRLRGKQI